MRVCVCVCVCVYPVCTLHKCMCAGLCLFYLALTCSTTTVRTTLFICSPRCLFRAHKLPSGQWSVSAPAGEGPVSLAGAPCIHGSLRLCLELWLDRAHVSAEAIILQCQQREKERRGEERGGEGRRGEEMRDEERINKTMKETGWVEMEVWDLEQWKRHRGTRRSRRNERLEGEQVRMT